MTVAINNYIENGFSHEDAGRICPAIADALKDNDVVTVDFDGIKYFTTLFFSQSLTYLIGEWGIDTFRRRLNVINLSESGQSTYQHAIEYAIEYYGQTEQQRKQRAEIVNNIIDDV